MAMNITILALKLEDVTIYNEEYNHLINNLTFFDLYRIFSNLDRYTVTRDEQRILALHAFRRITGEEKRRRDLLCLGEELNYNIVKQDPFIEEVTVNCGIHLNNISNQELEKIMYLRDKEQTCETLDDIFYRDMRYLERNYDTVTDLIVFILLIDGKYSGHIYTSHNMEISPFITNVIGIRSSMVELLSKNCLSGRPSLAPIFFSSILEVAKLRNDQYLRVINPFPPMPKILSRCGFHTIMGGNQRIISDPLEPFNWMSEDDMDDMIYIIEEYPEIPCQTSKYTLQIL